MLIAFSFADFSHFPDDFLKFENLNAHNSVLTLRYRLQAFTIFRGIITSDER